MEQIQPYRNRLNGCVYYLTLGQDIGGDWTVCKFYGRQRRIEHQRDAAQAQQYFQAEHRRRLARGYQQAYETV